MSLNALEEQFALEHKLRSACFDIVQWAEDNPNSRALDYAVDYARWAVLCPSEELPSQAPYVLANITHWRGDVAKETRATIKEFIAKVK